MKHPMNRTAALCSLTLLSLAAWAEEVPAPAPVEVVQPVDAAAAPAAEVAPAVDPTPVPAPAPKPAPAPAAKTNTDDVVFVNPNRKNPAVAPAARNFGFGVTLGVGYDSNILLENSSTPQATNAKGLALTGEVRAQVKLVNQPTKRLGLFGSAEIDDYPSEPTAQLMRWGLGFTAGATVGGFDPGLVVGYNKFIIDHEGEASAVNVNAYVAKVFESNVGILGLDSQYVDYFNHEDATGTLYDVAYRHWFLLKPRNINKRIELGIKGGKNFAQADDQSYVIITPWVGLFWRMGDKPAFGTQDIAARLSYEMRDYAEAPPASAEDAQTQNNLAFTTSYDFWLRNWVSTGLYFAYTERDSSFDIYDYNRVQVGARLTGTW